MSKKDKSLKATFEIVLENYKKKDFKNAEIYCYKILSIDPNHFDSISMLATIAAINKNFDKAIELLNKAIKIQPNNTGAIHNLGTAHKEIGKSKEAINYYKQVLAINPKHTNANYNLGLVFYTLNDLKTAKSYLKKTVDIQKNYGLAFYSLANVHRELKEFYDAVSCYQKAIEINPNLVSAHNNLGLVFRGFNDFENAIKCYQKAITLNPNHGGAHYNLALAYKELGQFDKSIEAHEAAIKIEPENLAHYYYLSELKKGILNTSLKNKINKIINSGKSTKSNNAFGNYLLANYERKTKNYENELKHLIKGHQNFFDSNRKKFELGVKYIFDDVLQISEGVKVDTKDQAKYNEIKPIFIIGVPRCGSTLIEKIIGSGKKMISMGEETSVFENYVNKKILDKQSLNLGSVKEVRNEFYDIYKQKGLLSKKYDNIFTDKSLTNFFYLELIKDIFPAAKIINCKRDILSSIMSIFQNNLTELSWTHDLDNVFKYFDNYFEIIENYNEINPNIIYQLELEKLINNPEEESKKLMKFCELPWDKKCLEFYKRKDLISKTASNIQIRKAIYKYPSDKYFPYKKFLDKYGKKYYWFK